MSGLEIASDKVANETNDDNDGSPHTIRHGLLIVCEK